MIDQTAKMKRRWSASLKSDLSLFMYPSLNVGNSEREVPNWSLTEVKVGEAELSSEPNFTVTKMQPKLESSMRKGETFLRKKMKDSTNQLKLDERRDRKDSDAGEGKEESDNDRRGHEIVREPESNFEPSSLRGTSFLPDDPKASNVSQDQSVEVFSSITRRISGATNVDKLARKNLDAKLRGERAILDKMGKRIPIEIGDCKSAILSYYASSLQIKDEITGMADVADVADVDTSGHSYGDFLDARGAASPAQSPMCNERSDRGGEEVVAGISQASGDDKNAHSSVVNSHDMNHSFYVGMGEAGHMGEFSEGQVDMRDEHEFVGEVARQSFFDRYQRIAGNRYDETISQVKVLPRLSSSPAADKNVSSSSRTGSNSHDQEREKHDKGKHVEFTKVHPMDKFLTSCLEKSIVPEPFLIKKSYVDTSTFNSRQEGRESSPDLRHRLKKSLNFKHSTDNMIFRNYGIGDEKASALGEAISHMPFIKLLDISNNRLSSKSLPGILSGITNLKNLMNLNLSGNKVDVVVATHIGALLKTTSVLRTLILDNCSISDRELEAFSEGLLGSDSSALGVHNLSMSRNCLSSKGGFILGRLLDSKNCALEKLDLSHNMLRGNGTVAFGKGLASNTTVKVMNLEGNRIDSEGTMAIGKSLSTNKTLRSLNLRYNDVGTKGCFVMASVLRKNTTLKKLSLVGNALGEHGGRCLLRAIMEGMVCWIEMTGCTFHDNRALDYDHSNPEREYGLELDDPYHFSILSELSNAAVTKPLCCFSNVKHFTEKNRAGEYVKGNGIELGTEKMRDVITGLITKIQEIVVQMRQEKDEERLAELRQQVVTTKLKLRKEFDRVQSMLPSQGFLSLYFKSDKRLPGPEDCMTDDAIEKWILIIHGAKSEEDRINWVTMILRDYYVTTSQIQYVLDKLESMQSDHLNLDRRVLLLRAWSKIFDSDKKFLFMSKQLRSTDQRELAKMLGFASFKLNFLNPTGHWKLNLANSAHKEVWLMLRTLEGTEITMRRKGKRDTSQKGNWSGFRNEKMNNTFFELNSSNIEGIKTGTIEFDFVSTTRPPQDAQPCSDVQFRDWLANLGITDSTQDPPGGVMFQMYLTHSACEHYFTVQQACTLIENIAEGRDQSDAAVAMFSRIVDLENFDSILRMTSLLPSWKQDIINRLGWLNVGNPMKPEGLYDINLMDYDQRAYLKMLIELGSSEPGVHIRDVKNSDIAIQEVYGNSSLFNGPTNKHVRLEYAEVNRNVRPNFSIRQGFLDQFLLGEKPLRKGIFTVSKQYAELEKAGKLASGPIKKQYEAYIMNR